MYTTILFLHILGATIWTGGHLVLAFSVLPAALKARDPARLLAFEKSYEGLGMSALAVQVLTGLWLAHTLQPSIADWFALASPQSKLILLKLGLLLLTAATAIDARLRIIPKLDARTLPKMAVRIALVTLFSVLFVAAGVSFRGGLLFGMV
ncbi:CopD family protein [Dokdonella sp.]|uniref:CopD family protein n=1 Tax=Dokdonella sp. TaxID=2291710 RepID=UPI0025C0DF01|nr:CopD family protein [Dokdonella sp.]MBX3691010.1 CopD family protein [Dokdonella sp.]MCW5569236.1 CopD family protein [Dokdonella sp.]